MRGIKFLSHINFHQSALQNHLVIAINKKNIYTNIDNIPSTMVYWLLLLHNFMQHCQKSSSYRAQVLLAVCRRFAELRASYNGFGWLKTIHHQQIYSFERQPHKMVKHTQTIRW